MVRTEKTSGQSQHQPEEQEDTPLIAPADNCIRQSNCKQQPSQRIYHRLTGQVMFSLKVTRLMEEFENITNVLGKRFEAALLTNITKDTDLGNAVVERKRVGDIRYSNGSNGYNSCDREDDQSQPASAQR